MKIADYIIKWRYEDVTFVTLENEKELRRAVKCLITKEGDKDNVIAAGLSVCSPVDNFDKEKGRRLSFERAVSDHKLIDPGAGVEGLEKEYTFLKSVRAAFWEGFRLLTKDVKWGNAPKGHLEKFIVNKK